MRLESKDFWLSKSRPMGHKALGLLGLGQKSLGKSRAFELWDSSPRDKSLWDWQSRPMPIPALAKDQLCSFSYLIIGKVRDHDCARTTTSFSATKLRST